jgi:hypothetical protein
LNPAPPSLEMPLESFPSLGVCIFCLKSEPKLTKEHIVPAALHGRLFFQGATCEECRKKHSYEQTVLTEDLLVPRVLLGLRGRKRDDKKDLKLPPVALGDQTTGVGPFDVELDIEEYPAVIIMPVFPPAGQLVGEVRGSAISMLAVSSSHIDLTPLIPNSRPRSGVTQRLLMTNGPLAMMLAKIAYCYGVARLGLEAFDGDAIRRLLAGDRHDTYDFVGGGVDQRQLPHKDLHELQFKVRAPFVTVLVCLFASFNGPIYEVVLGRIKAQ